MDKFQTIVSNAVDARRNGRLDLTAAQLADLIEHQPESDWTLETDGAELAALVANVMRSESEAVIPALRDLYAYLLKPAEKYALEQFRRDYQAELFRREELELDEEPMFLARQAL